MKNYVIINGTNSNTLTGLMINELPPITKPEMRTQVEEIDGRDGDIITKLGYSAYDKTITIGLFGTGYDVDNIIKFFNKEGTIVFSNELDKYYNFTQVNGFDIERLLKFKTASITFHCQPFKYPTIETPKIIQPTILTSDGESITINNTASDSLELSLKGNTSQASTPTPTSPVAVNVVSGDNDIKISSLNQVGLNDTASTTQYGLTYSVSNNILNVNGTATAKTLFQRVSYNILSSGTKTLRMTIDGGTFTAGAVGLSFRNSSDTQIEYMEIPYNGATSTKTINIANLDHIYIYATNGSSFTNAKIKFLLSDSNTDTYEPYKSQTYPIDLPVENLFDKSTITENKRLDSSGSPYSDNDYNLSDYIEVQPNTQYTYSRGVSASGGSMAIAFYNSSKTFISRTMPIIAYNTSSGTLTTPNNTKYVRITDMKTVIDTMQFELGSKANHYTDYGTTPIELNKISTYQDYIYKDSGKWYLHKVIGKVVLNGTESWDSWYTVDNSIGFYYYPSHIAKIGVESEINGALYCDKFSEAPTRTSIVYGSTEGIKQCGNTGTQYIALGIDKTRLSDYSTKANAIASLKTWLGNNLPYFYYVIDTPTNTEITDTNLISQLDAIEGAYSYETQTNISQINNDKPFIISASAVQSGTNEITINNIGNIYSKPLIALIGNGNVDIYLNNTQILKANVESKMNIDINTLEAYNPDTSALLNRQVIGNYNSMTFQPGNNKLTINGSLNKATITNYTRYL